jgi:hypothetical protein
MPEKGMLDQAEQDKEEGKAPSTQAGEFVREEIEHIEKGSAADNSFVCSPGLVGRLTLPRA